MKLGSGLVELKGLNLLLFFAYSMGEEVESTSFFGRCCGFQLVSCSASKLSGSWGERRGGMEEEGGRARHRGEEKDTEEGERAKVQRQGGG